jgi:hypothetical protein
MIHLLLNTAREKGYKPTSMHYSELQATDRGGKKDRTGQTGISYRWWRSEIVQISTKQQSVTTKELSHSNIHSGPFIRGNTIIIVSIQAIVQNIRM